MPGSAATLDVRKFIDERPLSPYQAVVLLLCFLIVFIDGFDTSAMGFVAPALVQGWKIKREALGPVLSAALVGLAVGALVSGPFADKLGRKTVLVASVILFGIGSIACSFANSLEALTVLRLLTGLGLGAAMPNAVTLTAEYAPSRNNALLISLMFCGFTFGAASGGFIAAGLIPHFGWPSVFLVGGLAPLLLAVLLAWFIPESARFLVVRGGSTPKVRRILSRIAPRSVAELEGLSEFTVPELGVVEVRNPVGTILSPPLVVGTLLMWATNFFGLLVIFLLTSWLPTLLRGAGFGMSASAVVTALFQLGGTGGALLVAWGMDRFGPHKCLALSYLLAAVCIFAVGHSISSVAALSATVLFAGFFTSGAQTPMNALGASFYPTQVRATGVSWMLGIGRFGAILGAYIGAPLLQLGWDFTQIFQALAGAALIAAVAVGTKGAIYHGRGSSGLTPAPRSA